MIIVHQWSVSFFFKLIPECNRDAYVASTVFSRVGCNLYVSVYIAHPNFDRKPLDFPSLNVK